MKLRLRSWLDPDVGIHFQCRDNQYGGFVAFCYRDSDMTTSIELSFVKNLPPVWLRRKRQTTRFSLRYQREYWHARAPECTHGGGCVNPIAPSGWVELTSKIPSLDIESTHERGEIQHFIMPMMPIRAYRDK